MKGKAVEVGEIEEAAVMSKVPICRPEAFIIRGLCYLIPIILQHAHSASRPQMCRQPLYLTASKFVCHYEPSSFSNVFATPRDLLHGLCLSQLLLHIFPHLSGNPIPIVAHCSSTDRSG